MRSSEDPKAREAKPIKDHAGITTKEGELYAIPEEGSLSLLALGYKGLMAWRAKRVAMEREREARLNERP